MAAYAFNFLAALGLSIIATYGTRGLARKFGWVAKPRVDRWHKKPTALFGGVGIFLAFAVVFLLRRPTGLSGESLLVFCATGMFVVGLIDDIVQMRPYAKLVTQIVIAIVLTSQGMRLHWLPFEVADQALTVFWLVGITNALNLLDNLDGLAGGIAMIAACFLVYFCDSAGLVALAALVAAFAGALVGFLIFNFNPASIFMGDCGSLFLGFFLGGVTLLHNGGGFRRHVIAVLAIPVLLLMIPILDTTLVTVLRKASGRPVSQGGRDHTSHRLVALGMSERGAALSLWSLAIGAGGIAVLVKNVTVAMSLFLIPTFVLAVVLLLIVVGRVQVYAPATPSDAGSGRALLPTLRDFAYKRRIFEVLNDLVIAMLAFYASFLLRFDGQVEGVYRDALVRTFPVLVGAQLLGFLSLGLYQGLWHHLSSSDLGRVVRSVFGGWVLSVVLLAVVTRLENVPRSVLAVDVVLLLAGVVGTRLLPRFLQDAMARKRTTAHGRKVLIYGAGSGGELAVREMLANPKLDLIPAGFVDDDRSKHGRLIHGVRVLGSVSSLAQQIEDSGAEEFLISSTKIEAHLIKQAELVCRNAGLTIRRVRIVFEETPMFELNMEGKDTVGDERALAAP